MNNDPFGGIENAVFTERGVFLEPHFQGEAEIQRCVYKHTLRKGDAFICEFKLLSSNLPNHPPGEMRTWYQDMKDLPIAHGQIKALMIGVSGQRHDAADPAFVQQMNPISKAAIDQRNILMGLRVFIRTDAKPSKPGAKVPFYTTYFWSPAPSLQGADQGAEILRRLASAPNPVPYPTAPAPVAPPGYGQPPPPGTQGYGAPQAYPPQAPPPAGPPGGYQPAYPVHPPTGQAPANPWAPPVGGGWDPNAGRR